MKWGWTETAFLVIALCANKIYFIDRLIEIETILSRRRFLDVVADPIDDSSGRSASPTIQPSASLTSPRKLQTACLFANGRVILPAKVCEKIRRDGGSVFPAHANTGDPNGPN